MNSNRPDNSQNLLSLQEAAQVLGVSSDVLLLWNEHNILKPTITQTGEIGYSHDQVDQFLSFQHSYQQKVNFKTQDTGQVNTPRITNRDTASHPETFSPSNFFSRQTATNEYLNSSLPSAPSKPLNAFRVKLPSYFLASSVGFVAAIVAIIVFVQHDGPRSIIDHYRDTSSKQSVVGEQTSNLTLPEHIVYVLPVQLKDDTVDNSIKTGDKSVLRDKGTTLGNVYTTSSKVTLISRGKNQMPNIVLEPEESASTSGVGTEDLTTYASSSVSCPTCTTDSDPVKNSTLDVNNNIVGEATNTGDLATILGGIGTPIANNSLTQASTSTQNPQLIFLSVIAVAAFVLPKQLAYGFKNPQAGHAESLENQIVTPQQKILALEQKMDGTVIVSFQGQEYKVSKPELFSESDRFIEQLMTLSSPNTKELEYDSFKDQKIMLTTPLSRLVTRLGFVGMKRDLFFPRTSKDRVLFRRYVTRDDLVAMNLTTEQILRDLTSVPPSKA